jgi:hypothetical protein
MRVANAAPTIRCQPLPEPAGQNPLGDEEPESGRSGAAECRHRIDVLRVVTGERQLPEDIGKEDEQRIARRVRQTEHFRGGHVLARVPHCCGWCDGEEVEKKNGERRDSGGAV